MPIRRAVYYAQFPLAVVLPLWVLISRGIVADGIGLAFLVYLVACPVLFVALAAIAGLVAGRKSVRDERAVSWLDAAALGALWVSLVVYGLFALPLLATLVVLLVVGTFWLVLVEWLDEARRRVKDMLDMTPRTGPSVRATAEFRQSPDVIVVPPQRITS